MKPLTLLLSVIPLFSGCATLTSAPETTLKSPDTYFTEAFRCLTERMPPELNKTILRITRIPDLSGKGKAPREMHSLVDDVVSSSGLFQLLTNNPNIIQYDQSGLSLLAHQIDGDIILNNTLPAELVIDGGLQSYDSTESSNGNANYKFPTVRLFSSISHNVHEFRMRLELISPSTGRKLKTRLFDQNSGQLKNVHLSSSVVVQLGSINADLTAASANDEGSEWGLSISGMRIQSHATAVTLATQLLMFDLLRKLSRSGENLDCLSGQMKENVKVPGYATAGYSLRTNDAFTVSDIDNHPEVIAFIQFHLAALGYLEVVWVDRIHGRHTSHALRRFANGPITKQTIIDLEHASKRNTEHIVFTKRDALMDLHLHHDDFVGPIQSIEIRPGHVFRVIRSINDHYSVTGFSGKGLAQRINGYLHQNDLKRVINGYGYTRM